VHDCQSFSNKSRLVSKQPPSQNKRLGSKTIQPDPEPIALHTEKKRGLKSKQEAASELLAPQI
jgi:hypothetical protein